MKKRTTAPARALATIALLGAVLVSIVVISASLSGGGSTGSHSKTGQTSHESGGTKKTTAKTYVVQDGDTLTSIAHQTGISVARIQVLNPGVDPQILISGQRLKLR